MSRSGISNSSLCQEKGLSVHIPFTICMHCRTCSSELSGVDAERLPLEAARARESDLGATVTQSIQRRRALGDADWVIHLERRQHPGVPQPQPARPLRDRGEQQFGSRAVAELGGPVVLDLPPALVAELVREASLLQGSPR